MQTMKMVSMSREPGSSQKEIVVKTRTEGTVAILAALLVLFSAMWDPRISIVVSVVALTALGVYRFVQKDR